MNETNEQQSLDLLSSEQLGEALEAVLFASGYPLSFEKLAQTFQKTEKEMRCFAEEYAKAYNQSSRGILFLILDDSCQLCSKEEYKEYITEKLYNHLKYKYEWKPIYRSEKH